MKRFLVIFTAMLLAASCSTPNNTSSTKVEPVAASTKTEPAAVEHTADAAPSLSEVMIQIGKDMHQIKTSFEAKDYPTISLAALSIANHPHIAPEAKAKLMKTLGPDMPKFGKHDKLVHGAASRLAAAADQQDNAGILTEITNLESGCTSCHTEFRARLQ